MIEFVKPIRYFIDLTRSLDKKMQEYKHTIDEIQVFIVRSHHGAQFSSQLATDVIRTHQQTLNGLNTKIETLHQGVEALKAAYSAFIKKIYGEEHDLLKQGT